MRFCNEATHLFSSSSSELASVGHSSLSLCHFTFRFSSLMTTLSGKLRELCMVILSGHFLLVFDCLHLSSFGADGAVCSFSLLLLLLRSATCPRRLCVVDMKKEGPCASLSGISLLVGFRLSGREESGGG